MLETQAVTIPRSAPSPRRAEKPVLTSVAALPETRPSDKTEARSRPSSRRKSADRLARSETGLIVAAAACTTLFCLILVVYLAAYARVTNLGLTQSRSRVELSKLKRDNETLRAQLAQAQSPDRIVGQATLLGMARGAKQVCYIAPGAAQAMTAAISDTGEQFPRVASSGENSINISAASLGH